MRGYAMTACAVLLALALTACTGGRDERRPPEPPPVKYDEAVIDTDGQTITYYYENEPVLTVPAVTGTAAGNKEETTP